MLSHSDLKLLLQLAQGETLASSCLNQKKRQQFEHILSCNIQEKHAQLQLDQPLTLLQPKTIKALLPPALQSQLQLDYFPQIDSSQRYLADTQSNASWHCCIAEWQYQAHGQRGKTWSAPFARGLWLSIAFMASTTPQNDLSTINFKIAKALAKTLNQLPLHSPIEVKWPNDLYCDNKKLAGLLTECSSQNQHNRIILGLGLNLNLSAQHLLNLPQHTINLSAILKDTISKQHIAALVLQSLCQA
jgi:BirA family transcriptional regulator, biotin operon repressor / biotin---[acetyl-CoA-carboxylase] ligase